MLHIYGIKRCDTMSKAMAWLRDRHIDFRLHDYQKDGVPESLLADWIRRAGWQSVVNARGTTFRKLPPALTADLDDGKALALLKAHASAIRRPIVDLGDDLLIGFDAGRWSKVFE
ncbi:Spx/MgsR family RNA polymerase-binding regulatory protein [Methyloversatilis thermotolerans]|uniref:Spx/MgsR family RNA polymerase-binding regulatory protein n=1 Tax=Methyloversatilis thermotolerans TaxID=1346290 RepID=UPI000370A949|nr:Spx/MgsR family RNA polymerase-binding regulatory protein [Methyloversatilis thermotolerans]